MWVTILRLQFCILLGSMIGLCAKANNLPWWGLVLAIIGVLISYVLHEVGTLCSYTTRRR